MNWWEKILKKSADISKDRIVNVPFRSKINLGTNEWYYDSFGQKGNTNIVRRIQVKPDWDYYTSFKASPNEFKKFVNGTLTPEDMGEHVVRDTSYFTRFVTPFLVSPAWYKEGKIKGSHPELDAAIYKTNNK